MPGIELDTQGVETNIVVFEVNEAAAFCARLAADGVIMGAFGPRTVRAVTHLDVSGDDIDVAVRAARSALCS